MREEYNSVLSTPIEADNIGRFSRYRYIGKTQISADISVDLWKKCSNVLHQCHQRSGLKKKIVFPAQILKICCSTVCIT